MSIEKGDYAAKVISVLGEPDNITVCGDLLWWNTEYLGKDVDSMCNKVFWYGTIDIEMWTFGFDVEDKVISKYHYVSP